MTLAKSKDTVATCYQLKKYAGLPVNRTCPGSAGKLEAVANLIVIALERLPMSATTHTLRRTLLAAAAVLVSSSGLFAAELPGADYFEGRWGTVSYNDEGDLGRMTQVARGYCGSLAYVIRRKSNETFEMYVAESLKEVRVMDREGKAFVVPVETDQGVFKGARELQVRNNNTFTLKYLENHNHQRYGLNVFVRCGGR